MYPNDHPCSDSQAEAVERFFGQPIEGLTGPQATALLDFREFGRAVVERVAPKAYGEEAQDGAKFATIYISNRREMAEEVMKFMRRRFEKGADDEGLKRAISRLDCFEEVSDFTAAYLGV